MYKTPLFVAVAAVSGVALVALAAAFLPDPRPVDAEDPIKITINPAAPTELDVVSVTLAGDLGEQFCGLEAEFFLIPEKNQIGIFLFSTAQICTQVIRPTTFSFTEEIGLLPAGEYRAWVTSYRFDAVNDLELVIFDVTAVAGVGGIAELPQLERAPLEANASDVNGGLVAGTVAAAAAGVLALGGAAWYAKRRFTG